MFQVLTKLAPLPDLHCQLILPDVGVHACWQAHVPSLEAECSTCELEQRRRLAAAGSVQGRQPACVGPAAHD